MRLGALLAHLSGGFLHSCLLLHACTHRSDGQRCPGCCRDLGRVCAELRSGIRKATTYLELLQKVGIAGAGVPSVLDGQQEWLTL